MGRFWESFATEELRTKALEENEAYNNQPEVKAFIEAQLANAKALQALAFAILATIESE